MKRYFVDQTRADEWWVFERAEQGEEHGPFPTEEDAEDHLTDLRSEQVAEAGGAAVEALADLYFVCDEDDAMFGESLYEIEKAARNRARERTA